MGIFGNLFGKNDNKRLKENFRETKKFDYSINTNVGDITFTINMTEEEMIERCQKTEENKLNPNSCQREPNDDEIKLPVKDFYDKYRGGLSHISPNGNLIHDEIVSRACTAIIDNEVAGYHYFVLLKSDFKHIEEKHNEWAESERKLHKTVELNFKGKDLEKEGKIDEAIRCYEENVKLGYPAMMSYDRLLVLYRRNKDYENEKRICRLTIKMCEKENERRLQNCLSREENKGLEDQIIKAHNENRTLFIEGRQFCVYNPYEVNKYKNRLEKIENRVLYEEISLPTYSTPYIVNGVPLGVQFENTIKLLPEFNFYADLPDNEPTNEYLWKHKRLVSDEKHKPEIWRIQNLFKSLITDAERYETIGLLDKAAVIYEQIVAEQYFMPNPYDKLIKIYSKAKLKFDEIRILKYAINHFSELRNRQKGYVIQLATKYRKLDFANERINNDKKISYYGGAFELYNPYIIISKWKERLDKLYKNGNNRNKSIRILR
ncbi:MAG: hypothetical protein LBS25_07660 [Candidatus Symbiothrix sp.]|jgi:hypothetical protein|nr:hypothetical protein [Candidatus Symbiothrix sp.]